MTRFCLKCGAENTDVENLCRACGQALRISPDQRREGIAFILNELDALKRDMALPGYVYSKLRRRYLTELAPPKKETVPPPLLASVAADLSPRPALAPKPTAPPRPVAIPSTGPGWMAEQQANLLLYLGAFLIVIAAVILVGYSESAIGGGIKMSLLVVYTLLFLATGVICMKFPRVQQAGLVFFAVGALMVPLNFVGAYVFFFAEEDMDPTGLWLAGSLSSALFYGAVSMQGISRWYSVPTVAAVVSAFTALLVLVDAPLQAYPASFTVLAALLAAPSMLRMGQVSDVFGTTGRWAAQIVAPLAMLGTLGVAAIGEAEPGDQLDAALWLNVSLTAVAFYAAAALLDVNRLYAIPTTGALVSAFWALVIFADAPPQSYPALSVGLAVLLAAPLMLKLGRVSDLFGEAGEFAAHIVVPAAILVTPYLAEADIKLWLNLSLTAVAFYGAAAFVHVGRLYAAPTVVALASALGAVLALADAPFEVYPEYFVFLAILLTVPSFVRLGKASDVFGETAQYAAHIGVPVAVLAALQMTQFEPEMRAYLPITGGLATLFYGAQAFWASRRKPDVESFLSVTALTIGGGTAVSLVYALDLGREWYGPAVGIVGWLYAGASEGFGPRWFGQRYLGWMALITITISWLVFEGLYADFPRHGAGVHFSAVVLYLVAARLSKLEIPLSDPTDAREGARVYRLPVTIPLVYAAGVALVAGFFHLLASLPAAETAGESDLAWPYFGLSLAVAAAAATTRWWWPAVRPHVYVIALAISLFVLLSSLEQEDSLALALALYTGLSLVLVLWEQEPLALPVPAVYGFFAVLAAWRYYDPPDAYLPLALSGVGCGLFGAYSALRRRYESWALVIVVLAFVYAIVAPIAGWIRLNILAQPTGFVGTEHFEETLLYQTSAASLFLLALLMVALAWLLRRIEIAVGATVLMMVALLLEIGHFRPDNIQAYTVPLGAYLLSVALLSPRMRWLPDDVRSLVGPVESLGAILIMAPSLVQSFDEGAWGYGVVLLGEGLGLVAVATVRRRLWLLGSAIGFVVLDGLHYLFFVGGPALPNWAMLAIAGTAVMAAGTAILFGRDQWTRWQHTVEDWWVGGVAQSKVG